MRASTGPSFVLFPRHTVKKQPKEAEILAQVKRRQLPRHIAIIMDGNGRWAKKRQLPRIAGHRAGIRAVRQGVEGCARLGVPFLTLYAFSVENWKRPQDEVNLLMSLLQEYLKKELPELIEQNIRLGVIGRIHELPKKVQTDLQVAVAATEKNTGLRLTLALNYGARAELVDAVRTLAHRMKGNGDLNIDEKTISEHLYTCDLPDPDLLIRTSGEMRLSNFLLWQLAYAEIWVTETLWPDFTQRDLFQAVLDFQKRERRFGGLLSAAPKIRRQRAVSKIN
ncbi:MAG TPA: isoprenyl transferase [Terriglobia bacterium]|nr:isoprenyl transferase [Terriglobia bacterium]